MGRAVAPAHEPGAIALRVALHVFGRRHENFRRSSEQGSRFPLVVGDPRLLAECLRGRLIGGERDCDGRFGIVVVDSSSKR